ncbi:MAG TPA: biosynthetic peptidoglycan transglycosylase [Candidatus Limnocylindria bacterium]|jgi:membrane peptidoglycan carboxypeptidase|nr:biosynthetic peptidoglycan transglycosylase [Candidatus Limnocylindria bacterium]
MSWLPVPVQRLALALIALIALATPSFVTLWVSTPSADDVQERVLDATGEHGVVLLAEDEVPALLAQAVVVTEDERFYSHHGIDTIGLGRAFLYDATHFCFCQGGSTITEQLVKDVYLNGSNEGYNKIVDVVLALKVEQTIGKRRIMADYLSEITTGYNRYGVSAAACAYFHRPLGNLSIGQYALLAGLTQAPSLYDPTVDPDLAALRRSGVLAAMVSHNVITPEQAANANAEPVLAPGPPPTTCP